MHDWLVWFILEIALPALHELRRGPLLHSLQFMSSRSDLHACFNTVRGQRTSAFEIPLVEHPLLHFRVSTGEVVE